MIKLENISGVDFKKIYTALNYSQQAIASELGYNPRQIRRWERKQEALPRSVVFALAAILIDHKKLIKKPLADVFSD